MRSRIRHVRTNRATEVLDEFESSDADVHDDLDLALIQTKAETLVRVDEALVRLDADEYGGCFGSGGVIAATRLRALPFAVRCTACEESREQAAEPARRPLSPRRNGELLTERIVSTEQVL